MEQFRVRIIQGIIVAAGIVLILKAAQLQLFDASYRERAQSTTLEKRILYPSRGLIYDRNGTLLVHNNTTYDLEVIYNQVDPAMDVDFFCRLLRIERSEFDAWLNKDWSSVRFSKNVPFVFMKNISATRFSRLEEHLHEFPGFYSVIRNVREYPHQSACHLLGYIGEVDQKTVDDSLGVYESGDYIGISGIEAYYESMLKGDKGVSYILKDNLGRKVGSFDNGSLDSAATSGKNLQLSIDLPLQQYAEQLMKDKQGAIVAMDPKTGEILAMVSAPYYDPNILSIQRARSAGFEALSNDSLQPFFNRAIMAKYPPASVFKPLVALVAMQQKVLQSNKTIYCPGYFELGNRVFGCRNHPTPYNVSISLQWSCNTYYFRTYKDLIDLFGQMRPDLGLNLFNDYLKTFSLGQPTGLDIPGESTGNLPGSEFFANKYPERWYSSFIVSMGIGQGEVELTTVQMANLAAIIANKGRYYPPHLIRSVNGTRDDIPIAYKTPHNVPIDAPYFTPVIDGMEAAVSAGTARRSYVRGLDICGKTGTSQNPFGEDHSVFFGFAPKDNPQIAVAVFVENAGSGGAFAAPIASFIMEKYVTDSIAPYRKYMEDLIINTPTGSYAK
jgi:penicillin-binding protein 2